MKCDYCGEELDKDNVWVTEGQVVHICSFCQSILEQEYSLEYLPPLDIFEWRIQNDNAG